MIDTTKLVEGQTYFVEYASGGIGMAKFHSPEKWKGYIVSAVHPALAMKAEKMRDALVAIRQHQELVGGRMSATHIIAGGCLKDIEADAKGGGEIKETNQ